MRGPKCPRRRGVGRGWGVALIVALLCGAFGTAGAYAQKKNDAGKKPNPRTIKPDPKLKSNPAPKTGSKIKPRRKVDPKRGRTAPKRRSAKKPTLKPDPNAKWFCAKDTVTLESVWRNDKSLTFEFTIENKGTADLRILARGG